MGLCGEDNLVEILSDFFFNQNKFYQRSCFTQHDLYEESKRNSVVTLLPESFKSKHIQYKIWEVENENGAEVRIHVPVYHENHSRGSMVD